jgi:aryl carrier-like protein
MKERIAEWSVPAEVVVIDAIPMTPNGKIDRQRLTAMERVSSSYDLSFIAPTTDFEQTIASIWQELLGIEKIGVDANFFDLGGHSLLLVAVRNKLRDALRRDLSLVDVYRNPTIRSQARLLSAAAPELGSVQGAINRASRRRKAHRVRTKEQVE